ncbi:Acetyltransferase (GNAT) family protein [Streptoalloteichus tenebrarius]|uniref:Acetyltransferase (GNAT) family protein n=1 Tax=Streptoalloteichus tenebrarius (strain ATCC 17920 / DSM 40477 / JCM 4838 / CBS 697.72 / NBRC 16177 / NCIMB 11028 / NRRL B-12390 / A12253. 1 / ISP 5477) TaxID=1933 RepID=A0ABT1HZU2_STRSD|nr:GNAT family N-acetyltransferase [Streptoalloteichus tenebrarius]MCP2261015.1 Acetyltransferase (GNAT) family protein [Streptoalloteichus tenebrarius]BFF03193.1 GNAT family N-acetyltransferase [Streptoalloteichus tenebrarius]
MTEPATVPPDYELDDDPARVDRDALWAFLSEQAYWARWRDRAVVERQLDAAWRVVGVYERATGRMVGFARAAGDGVSVAYLADVYVLPEHRGHGLGVALVRAMVDEGPGATLRWMLHTNDAHGLYAKFGFAPPNDQYLERPRRLPEAAAGGAG